MHLHQKPSLLLEPEVGAQATQDSETVVSCNKLACTFADETAPCKEKLVDPPWSALLFDNVLQKGKKFAKRRADWTRREPKREPIGHIYSTNGPSNEVGCRLLTTECL